MDPVDPVALARQLIDIDSTTGREGEVAAVLAAYLRERGYSVLEQPLADGRAQRHRRCRRAAARVLDPLRLRAAVLSEPASKAIVLYGRGACDAKGILAAQVAAAERLRAAGESRVGLRVRRR